MGGSGWSGSRGLMPLAARHTAISPMRAVLRAASVVPRLVRRQLAGVIMDLIGEVGDQLGSLCQVGPPNGISMKPFLECPGAKAADPGWG